MHRRVLAALTGATLLLAVGGGSALAGDPSGTGQPNASCEESALAPQGFSSGGFANAELHYAGNGVPSLDANSDHAVSQYDVACYQVSLHH